MPQTVRICMLNADIPVPAVFTQRAPTYGRIFHTLLANAAPSIKIQSTDFNVIDDEYPPSLDSFDAILVSGSANSTYDDLPWIRKLDAYIRNVYDHHPRIRLFGSCFGHQLICQSLLGHLGVRVEPDPQGWEIGVKEVTFHREFLQTFGKRCKVPVIENAVQEKMRIQFVHHDHVVVPSLESLPESWVMLGKTEHCAVQGIYEPGRVLTLQGHFEFDRFVNSECIKYFFAASWDPERLQEVFKAIDADDDSIAMAQMVLQFFLEEDIGHLIQGGLLTPPLEA